MTMRKTTMAASLLLLFGAAGCADLQVDNLNAPDKDRALRNPVDVEALIGGGYQSYWLAKASQNGPMAFLSTASLQHSAYPANFAMVDYSKFPRIPIQNSTSAGANYDNFAYAWTQNYKAISSVADGFRSMAKPGFTLGKDDKGQDFDLRAKAYGRFVQGAAHGAIALLFDQAVVFDETMSPDDSPEFQPASKVMEAAFKYLDEAYDLTQKGTFTLPTNWMSVPVTNVELGRLIRSTKAQLRANVARTPADRKAVNWDEVIKDIDAGITADWQMNVDKNQWTFSAMSGNIARLGWSQLNYFVLGMADTSGLYQKWMALPLNSRSSNFADKTEFLIQTPDKRFPKGATVDAQKKSPGTMYAIPTDAGYPGGQWGRPDRGEWRWSYYRDWTWDKWYKDGGMITVMTKAEMNLLKAEARYYKGDMAGVAALINPYRTAAGLNATDAAGTNTSCVPKMANGSCGNLWEMLKWEKRLETMFKGAYMASWYFDGRGWGDLPEGTFLELPVPDKELQIVKIPNYTFGGVGQPGGAPKGSYGY